MSGEPAALAQRTVPARVTAPAALELRWRLSLAIGVLLTVSLSVAALVAVATTRGAVQREVGASLRAATASLALTIELLEARGMHDADATLRAWSAAYAQGRHLCIWIESPGDSGSGCAIPATIPGVPAWFVRGAESFEPPVRRPVDGAQGRLTVHLVSDPRDELREAWTDARSLLLTMAALVLLLNACVVLIVSRALGPLKTLVSAMDQIAQGHARPELPAAGGREVAMLAGGLRDLAQRLASGKEALRALHLRNLQRQEDERRWVARELHDEIGQHVAAIEMETIRISRIAPHDEAQRHDRLQQLRASVAQIHHVSRRILQRLRPPLIEKLGLHGAVESLVQRWQDEHPELDLSVHLDASALARVPAEGAVHVYRIVQEALSNVARHAGARHVWLRLTREAQTLQLDVRDDGRGFLAARVTPGLGWLGMQERAEALSGTLSVHAQPGAGTQLALRAPLR